MASRSSKISPCVLVCPIENILLLCLIDGRVFQTQPFLIDPEKYFSHSKNNSNLSVSDKFGFYLKYANFPPSLTFKNAVYVVNLVSVSFIFTSAKSKYFFIICALFL